MIDREHPRQQLNFMTIESNDYGSGLERGVHEHAFAKRKREGNFARAVELECLEGKVRGGPGIRKQQRHIRDAELRMIESEFERAG